MIRSRLNKGVTNAQAEAFTRNPKSVVLDNKMAAKFLLVAVQYLRRGGIPASNIRRMVNVEILRTPNPAVPGCDCDACSLAREQLRSHK